MDCFEEAFSEFDAVENSTDDFWMNLQETIRDVQRQTAFEDLAEGWATFHKGETTPPISAEAELVSGGEYTIGELVSDLEKAEVFTEIERQFRGMMSGPVPDGLAGKFAETLIRFADKARNARARIPADVTRWLSAELKEETGLTSAAVREYVRRLSDRTGRTEEQLMGLTVNQLRLQSPLGGNAESEAVRPASGESPADQHCGEQKAEPAAERFRDYNPPEKVYSRQKIAGALDASYSSVKRWSKKYLPSKPKAETEFTIEELRTLVKCFGQPRRGGGKHGNTLAKLLYKFIQEQSGNKPLGNT